MNTGLMAVVAHQARHKAVRDIFAKHKAFAAASAIERREIPHEHRKYLDALCRQCQVKEVGGRYYWNLRHEKQRLSYSTATAILMAIITAVVIILGVLFGWS